MPSTQSKDLVRVSSEGISVSSLIGRWLAVYYLQWPRGHIVVYCASC